MLVNKSAFLPSALTKTKANKLARDEAQVSSSQSRGREEHFVPRLEASHCHGCPAAAQLTKGC